MTDRVGQVAGTAKQTAAKAKGPAVAVGAAAAGVAGGLLIRSRLSRPKLLGVPLPRSLGKPSLDVKSIAKTVGGASQSFARTSKTVSKDIERAGDQAERIGKILGSGQLPPGTADDVHEIREQLDRVNRQSPLEVVLDGLTHRRGAHRREG